MNERTWWAARVKPAWHQPLKGWIAWKLQDHAFKGFPDVLVNAKGRIALVELKYEFTEPTAGTIMFVEPPVKPSGKGLTVEQRNHLQQWQDTGGWSFGFFGVARRGWLISLEAINPEGMTTNYMLQVASVYCDGYDQFKTVMQFLQRIETNAIDKTRSPVG